MVNEVINLKKSSFESGKVAVKRSFLYGKESLNDFVSLSFDEILKKMEEYDFKKSIDTSYLQYDGFYLIERILNFHFSRVYWEIFRFTSKNNKLLFDSYYLKYQIQNLMTYVRCKLSDEKNIEGYLIGDKSKKIKYLKAMEMPLKDGLVYISKKLSLNHSQIIKIHSKGLFQLENYLYKIYFEKLISYKFKYNHSDEKAFLKYIKKQIDLLNVRTYLKLKSENIDTIDFNEIFINGGNLNSNFYEKLNSQNSNESVFKKLHNQFCKNSYESDEKTIVSIDSIMNEFQNDRYKYLNNVKFGSPFYLLKYLFEVERQSNKLRILLKSKYMNLSEEETLKLMV